MNPKVKAPAEVVVFAPHPDDGELGAGGLLARLRGRGMLTAIVDLTQGELGTKGDPATRAKEATAAAQILELQERICLDLGDGNVADVPEQRREVVSVLRILRPRLVLTTWAGDEHPDHRAAFHLVRSAFFMARLSRFETGQGIHAPEQLWTYGIHHEDPGSFVVDISAEFEQKVQALRCYVSQFVHAELPEGYQYAATSDYLGQVELRGRYWGGKIGAAYGEAFAPVTTLRVDHF